MKIKQLARSAPLLAMLVILAVEEAVVYHLNPGTGLWPLGALAFPLLVCLGLDKYLRHNKDWYPYAVEDLEDRPEPCPVCGSDEYYREPGWLADVDRCLNCRVEGGNPIPITGGER